MVYTGKLRWIIYCDRFGRKTEPRLQQQFYHPPLDENDPVTFEWEYLDIVEEKSEKY